VCPRFEPESHRETDMRRDSHQVSILAIKYTLDRQSGQDGTGQCGDSMNSIQWRKMKQ